MGSTGTRSGLPVLAVSAALLEKMALLGLRVRKGILALSVLRVRKARRAIPGLLG